MNPHQPRIDRLHQLISQEEQFMTQLQEENMKDINALMVTSITSQVAIDLSARIHERKHGITRTKNLIDRYKKELNHLQKSS